jgi:hypothetical protein
LDTIISRGAVTPPDQWTEVVDYVAYEHEAKLGHDAGGMGYLGSVYMGIDNTPPDIENISVL